MTDPIHPEDDAEFTELSSDLQALDDQLGRVLSDVSEGVDPSFVQRVYAASRTELPARTLSFADAAARSAESSRSAGWLRAAAAILLVTGVALVAWFSVERTERALQNRNEVMVVDNTMPEVFGYSTGEEAMLVAVLDGDGAWLDHSALEHPATIEAEPVLRTQGTNVDDLAFEIDLILGATS